MKSQGELFPFGLDYTDALAALAVGFETFRYRGLSNSEARAAVQFIYGPKTYLITREHFPREFALDLGESQVNQIVDNAFLNFLDELDLTPGENLNYLVASLENDEIVDNLTE